MSNTPRMITVASSNHDFLAQEEYDQYSDSTVRSILCFRAVAFIVISLYYLLSSTSQMGSNKKALS